MNPTQRRVIFFVLLAAFAAGFWIVAFYGRNCCAPGSPVTTAATTQATAPAASPVKPAANEAASPAKTAKPVPFALDYVDLDTSRETAEACLVFTEALLQGPAAHYEDYVAVRDHPDLAVQAKGAKLCIGGLGFGRGYEVELRAGLPAASGAKLAEAQSVPVSFADKLPLVRFSSTGKFILPRTGNAGVPVTTINLDELAIKVYRVSDRALFEKLELGATTAYWELQDFAAKTALVWQGTMKTPGRRNEAMLTAFPIRDVVKPWKPGVYVVLASDNLKGKNDERQSWATQLVYDTDLGLTVFRGQDGLNAVVRSIASAKPVAGVKLALIAKSNEELGIATTDATGRAQFAAGLMRGTGGSEPQMLMAYGPSEDFSAISLASPGFDLSDRGVSGRASPGALDVFVTSERGIYRPGETVNLVTLVRDASALAVAKAPVTLVLLRPDGLEQRRFLLEDKGDGGSHVAFALSPTAQHGLWNARVVLDGDNALGETSFMVDDFVPQRLKVTLASDQDALVPDEKIEVMVEARFLYGAPATELGGEASIELAPDPAPFPNFSRFHFGLKEEKLDLKPIPLEIDATDAYGKTVATGELKDLPKSTRPLKGEIQVSVNEPGGRATSQSLTLPVRSRPLLLGLRALFDNVVEEGKDAAFELVALDAKGTPVARQHLAYRLTRDDRTWQWYQRPNGLWAYEPIHHEHPVEEGMLDATAEKPATLSIAQPRWGDYRLTVTDEESGAMTSLGFQVGWWEEGGEVSETPDKVEVVADRAKYKTGETAHITVKAPFEGEVLVTVAGNRVFESHELHLPSTGASIDLPVSDGWGSGAYVMATAYRPLGGGKGHEPVRAVGLSWIGLDVAARTLEVKLDLPDRVRPRARLEIPLTVAGLAAGETAFVTLAAVDEGILQLTRFKTPSPADYYYAKRALGVSLRDDYGRLLDGQGAPAGAIRAGGDSSLGGAALPVVPTRTVALFSGIVETDASGHAKIAFDIPDFEGELRFMALAYDKTQLGKGERPLTVRDALVTDVTLPRFLAPGDESRLALLIHNVEGAAGTYHVALTASGTVVLDGATERQLDMPVGKRELLSFPITANDVGIGSFTLKVEGPGGFAVTRDWQIAVRAPQLPVTTDLAVQVKPGESFTVDPQLVADYLPGSTQVGLTLSTWHGFNVPALLAALDRYPQGCLEQTTSRAFPLLYFNDVAANEGVATEKALPERIQDAIDRITDMQRGAGDFGLWGPYDSAYPWLSVFALDFLYEANQAGYKVPPIVLQRGSDWLHATARGRARDEDESEDSGKALKGWEQANIRAYAFYVLAKMGAANIGELRYFHDNKLTAIASAIGYGQLGAALAMTGDRTRASHVFDLAGRMLRTSWRDDYYGSHLRDLSALVAAESQAGDRELLPALVDQLAVSDYRLGWTTTQEQAWMLIAEHALLKSQGELAVSIADGPERRSSEPIRLVRSAGQIAQGFTVKNLGDKPIWSLVSVTGVPRELLPPTDRGFTIRRSFHDMGGKIIDPSQLKQNERFLVLLEGAVTDNLDHEAVLVNLLPAGWEIESVVKSAGDGGTDFDWLKLTEARMRQARDDQFVAALSFTGRSVKQETDHYAQAFIVRVAIPGNYVLPAATIADMYRPAVTARTGTGSVTVEPREPTQ